MTTKKPPRTFVEVVEPKAIKYLKRRCAELEAEQEIDEYMKHTITEEETHAPIDKILRNPS